MIVRVEKDLNQNVNNYIKWYNENVVKKNYFGVNEIRKTEQMRNFIEKMAVWYELIYPDYKVKEIIEFDNYDEFSRVKHQDEILDFYSRLSLDEKILLLPYEHSDMVCLGNDSNQCKLFLNKEGIVEKTSNVESWSGLKIKDKELEGLCLKEVLKTIKSKNIHLPENNQLRKEIIAESQKKYQIEAMLDCIMYRIIERGGKTIGPYRAFVYALDFEKNIDIPIKYGIDLTSPKLDKFIEKYLREEGNPYLICYLNYFDRADKKEPLKSMYLDEILVYLNNNKHEPTDEEIKNKLLNISASKSSKEQTICQSIKKLKFQAKNKK